MSPALERWLQKQDRMHALERGDVTFLYRPRVGHERPRGLGDVQGLFLLMSPYLRHRHRLVCIGRKRLPDPHERGHARYWAFVAAVASSAGALRDRIGERIYQTKTRGVRHQPARASPARASTASRATATIPT
jgi:hypothetical protein